MSRNRINPYSYYFGLCIAVSAVQTPAFCQKTYDPNLGHFYMGRQQITIEDNSPIINDKTGSTANGANGGMPNRVVPLPKAGWQGYAPVETPGINPNLPKVPAPVRQLHNAQVNNGPNGLKGRAGKYTAKKPSSPANAIRGYKPYTKYPEQAVNPQAASDLGVNTHVKGSLLHWARHNTPQQ